MRPAADVAVAAARRDGAGRWHGVSNGAITGSIHKIGALVQGLPACNGWIFWHFFREGRYEPIDALRSLLRASLREAAEEIPARRPSK